MCKTGKQMTHTKTYKTVSKEGIISKINTFYYWSEGNTWNEAVSTLHSKCFTTMGSLSSNYWKKYTMEDFNYTHFIS